jgi:predicted MPP superfamily phosphohydrolase
LRGSESSVEGRVAAGTYQWLVKGANGRKDRMSRFSFVIIALHAYIGARLLPDLPGGALAIAIGIALLAASVYVIPYGFGARHRTSSATDSRRMWAGLLAMGAFSTLFVLTVLRDVALLGSLALVHVGVFAVPVAAIARDTAVAVPLLTLVITALGYVNARRTAQIRNVDVPIHALPAALQGFTIVQITDVHVGPTIGRPYVEAIVAAVNRLDADVVAITGDLVDGSVRQLAPHVAPLARLASRHGTFFVTGNHEYYSGAASWLRELRKLGVNVLLNEHVVLDHEGASIVLAGVTDFSAHHYDASHRSDPGAALAGAPGDAAAKVLLAHQPRSATAAADAGFDLQLSGHTHGGQFWPWNFFVRFQQPFTAGLKKLGRLWVYTSRGTGYWGPPKRFGAPSEITRLRLVAG